MRSNVKKKCMLAPNSNKEMTATANVKMAFHCDRIFGQGDDRPRYNNASTWAQLRALERKPDGNESLRRQQDHRPWRHLRRSNKLKNEVKVTPLNWTVKRCRHVGGILSVWANLWNSEISHAWIICSSRVFRLVDNTTHEGSQTAFDVTLPQYNVPPTWRR